MPCRVGDWPIPEESEEHKSKRIKEEQNQKIRKAYLSDLQGDEKVAFGSFMTVFLCKAMELIEVNGLMGQTYEAMEWWYKEHKYRDTHLEATAITQKELEAILERIKNHYSVK